MIFVADIPFNDLWQRPQELATHLGVSVYIRPGKTRFGLVGTWGRIWEVAVPVWHFRSKHKLLNWFCLRFSGVLDPVMRAVQRYYIRQFVRELGRDGQWFVQSVQLSHLARGRVHFDYIDRYGFGSPVPAWMDRRFKEIATRADSASATHPLLACELERPCVIVPNAYSPKLKSSRTVYGYWGLIGEHIDWDWVLALLSDPAAEVVMVGRATVSVPHHPRLYVVSQLPHGMIPILARMFDVGIIPWKRTYLTEAVDPVKAYEYEALGLPTRSTLGHRLEPGTWEDRAAALRCCMFGGGMVPPFAEKKP